MTTYIVPALYLIMAYIVTLIIFYNENRNFIFRLLAFILITLFILSDNTLYIVAHSLFGEMSAILFSILHIYFLKIKNDKYDLKYFFIGITLGLAVSTKLIMIFFVVAFLGIYLIDTLYIKNINIKQFGFILLGLLSVFLLLYIFRIIQFNFDINLANKSIVDFLRNMLLQSKSGYNKSNIQSKIFERLHSLESIISIPYFSIIIISIPTFLYCYFIIKKGNIYFSFNQYFIYLGVCASSIYIYYILFGSEAYYYKRLIIYGFLLYVYYIYIFLTVLIKIKTPNIFIKRLCLYMCILMLFFSLDIKNIYKNYLYFDLKTQSYGRKCQDELIDFIKSKKDSSIFLIFYALNPDVNILANVKQYDILKFDKWVPLLEKKEVYLVSSNVNCMIDFDILKYIKDSGYDVENVLGKNRDYEQLFSFWKSKYLDLYTCYKISNIGHTN